MPDDGTPSYWELKRLYGYVLPPILGVCGVYSVIKREFSLGGYHLEGVKAVLAGLGVIAAGVLVLVLIVLRDSLLRQR